MWMGDALTLVNVSNHRFVIPASISLPFITETIWGKKKKKKIAIKNTSGAISIIDTLKVRQGDFF